MTKEEVLSVFRDTIPDFSQVVKAFVTFLYENNYEIVNRSLDEEWIRKAQEEGRTMNEFDDRLYGEDKAHVANPHNSTMLGRKIFDPPIDVSDGSTFAVTHKITLD